MKIVFIDNKAFFIGTEFSVQETIVLRYLNKFGEASASDLENAGVKNPSRVISRLRRKGIFIITHLGKCEVSPNGHKVIIKPASYEAFGCQISEDLINFVINVGDDE